MEILCRFWLTLDEVFHFFFFKQVVSTINRLVADTNFRNITYSLASTAYESVWCITKISIDSGNSNLLTFIKKILLFMLLVRKANHHDVYMCFQFGFTIPTEGAMGKVDTNPSCKKWLPKICYLLTLGNGIGRD